MNENSHSFQAEGIQRRTVVKAAAWAAPVIAAAVAVPAASASEPPQDATSIGATTTSPRVGNLGLIEPFGLDQQGNRGLLPAGQTFTLSVDFDWSQAEIIELTGGTITDLGGGKWLITPDPGVTSVIIRFRSQVTGNYTLTSNGPIDPGQTWGGQILP